MVIAERAPREVPTGRPRGSRRTVRIFYLLVVALAVYALVLFLTDHPAKSPVYAAPPTNPGPVSAVHGQCRGTDGLGNPNPRRDQVWVDADPSGAVALWLPGMNDRPCRSVMTRLDVTHARDLASAVRSAKPFSSGAYNCAADQGASVTVFFSYPGRVKAEVVRLILGGCGGVTAPGRDSRILPETGYAALRPAPGPWGAYFGG